MLRIIALLALATIAQAQAPQEHKPLIVNGTPQAKSAASGLEAAIAAAAKEQGGKTFWIGYEVATTLSDRMMCCFNNINQAGQ
ncbi:MAG TPA: hypothetical protein VM009_05625, partial [Terriglobales bacterium]|nr:hypothetical protein [Terriglobales bacterium]